MSQNANNQPKVEDIPMVQLDVYACENFRQIHEQIFGSVKDSFESFEYNPLYRFTDSEPICEPPELPEELKIDLPPVPNNG